MALSTPKRINVVTALLALLTFPNAIMLIVLTAVFLTHTEPHLTATPIVTALVFTIVFGAATFWSYTDDKKRASTNKS